MRLHCDDSVKLVRGAKQYIYDQDSAEYLDCISSSAHVGHCHPHVVSRTQRQMSRLVASQGFMVDSLSVFLKQLTALLPRELAICYLTNSRSQACDLAVRLACSSTNRRDVISVESSAIFERLSLTAASRSVDDKDRGTYGSIAGASRSSDDAWLVHGAALPGPHHNCPNCHSDSATNDGAGSVKCLLSQLQKSGNSVAAYASECVFSHAGVIVPPEDYFGVVYRAVRSLGGLCIMDETFTGLGRIGGYYWGFEKFGVVPDIVIVGENIGNGFPFSVVATRADISDKLPDFITTFSGNPVSCVVGSAVLDVIANEQLLTSADNVGRVMRQKLSRLAGKHDCIGEIRGSGLIYGVTIVTDTETGAPNSSLARLICRRLSESRIIVATSGASDNVLTITPPMCFTVSNVHQLCTALDNVLMSVTPSEFINRETADNTSSNKRTNITESQEETISPSSKRQHI